MAYFLVVGLALALTAKRILPSQFAERTAEEMALMALSGAVVYSVSRTMVERRPAGMAWSVNAHELPATSPAPAWVTRRC